MGKNNKIYKLCPVAANCTYHMNKLEDTVVTADSVTAFSSAMGRVLQGAAPPHIGSQSRNVF